MKKTHRILALLLSLCLVVSLAACSGGTGAGTPETSAPETSAPETAAPSTGDATSISLWVYPPYGDGLYDKKKEEWWAGYFQIEKGIYEQILSNPTEVITGTVKDLAEKYNTEILIMTGFLDGINESLKGYENPIDTMEEDTEVKIEIDPEKLYYNMVEAKANWLYELPQWDEILTPDKRKELYKSQKASGTVRKGKKIFPNDPCPCGSGKKYKKCCGKNA